MSGGGVHFSYPFATIDFGTRTGAIYNVVSDVLQDGGAGAEKHVATTVV